MRIEKTYDVDKNGLNYVSLYLEAHSHNVNFPEKTFINHQFLHNFDELSLWSIAKKRNSYITFKNPNFYSNLEQTIWPFFDAQPVKTDPASPLSGVGLYVKSNLNRRRFVGLMILTIDYSQIIMELNKNEFHSKISDYREYYDEIAEDLLFPESECEPFCEILNTTQKQKKSQIK